MPNLPPVPDAIMKIVKCNCTKSNRRTGKCIYKKAKLYCTNLCTCSLDNHIVCEIEEINDKRIVNTSHVGNWINVSSKFCHIETNFWFSVQIEGLVSKQWKLRAEISALKFIKWLKFLNTCFIFALIQPNKCRILKALYLWVFILKYAPPFNKRLSTNKRCSSRWDAYQKYYQVLILA